MITPFPCNPTKPGSASLPFFGVSPLLLNEKGEVLEGENEGILVLNTVTPGMCRTVYGDHERFEMTYYKCYPGYYFTGDGARRDKDGYYWLTGRVDDVINVSGHRLGTAEIENALNTNPVVVESAVVGFPHNIKGTGIYAFVVVRDGVDFNESVRNSIRNTVREEIGPIATPDVIQCACGLPKTRSGKIMRRILRKIASDELDNMGDTSTLADPSVVQKLIDGRERH